jgi:hypothetical protein
MMRIDSYGNEPESIAVMNVFLEENEYITDINDNRKHHEIYLSDPRKVSPEKLKTVIRYPIKNDDYPDRKIYMIVIYNSFFHVPSLSNENTYEKRVIVIWSKNH